MCMLLLARMKIRLKYSNYNTLIPLLYNALNNIMMPIFDDQVKRCYTRRVILLHSAKKTGH